MNLSPKLEEIADIFKIPSYQIQIYGSQCVIQGNGSQVFIDHSHPHFYSLRFFERIIFQNCHFKAIEDGIILGFMSKNISFSNCHFLDKTILLNFEGDIEFDDIHFYKQVEFRHSIFQGNFKLSNAIFYQEVTLFEASFQPLPKDKTNDNSKSTIFANIIFKEKVNINGTIFYGKTRFDVVRFDKDFFITTSIQSLHLLAGKPTGSSGIPTKFLNNVDFFKVEICGNLEITDTCFERSVDFNNSSFHDEVFFANNIFNNIFVFHKNQCSNLVIRNNTFAKSLTLKDLNHLKFLEFFSCIFLHFLIFIEIDFHSINTDFSHSFFKGGVNFVGKTFLNANFFQAQFEKNTDFSFSTFVENADFQKTSFLESVSFYGAKFENTPNFAQSSFRKELNIINTNLSFDYENVKEKILQTHQNNNQDKKSLSFIINDFRDSFRIFKNTLSKEGNLLDASNYHRVELYCKEIELDSKKPSILSREWIDKWQLCLYRHTSDHHTDLLKIISWVIVAIGVFGLLLFACKYGTNLEAFVKNHSENTFVALFDTSIITQNKIVIWFAYALGFFSFFWKWSRIVFFSSITLCITLVSYKYILGIGSFLTSKISSNPIENFLLVLYTLVMILLLFSLQKTARKNSIIPS